MPISACYLHRSESKLNPTSTYNEAQTSSHTIFNMELSSPSNKHPMVDIDISIHVCTEFSLFPRLPKELQLEIIRWTFPRFRCLTLNRNFLCDPHQQPIALSINSESRKETLKYYQPLLCPKTHPGWPYYFNPSLDTIKLADLWCLSGAGCFTR